MSGVCGVDSKEIVNVGEVSWVLGNFISVLLCSLILRFERFFYRGGRTNTRNYINSRNSG